MRPVLVLVIITFVTAFSSFRIVLSFFEMQCYKHVSSYIVIVITLQLDIVLGSKSYTLAPFEE